MASHVLPERTGQQLKKSNPCKNSISITALKELIIAAQAYDQTAIDKLCQAFRPLILKEANRVFIRKALGQDAENTAWEIFLDLVHSYNETKYSLFPGLVRKKIHYMLIQRVVRKKSVADIKVLQILDDPNSTLQISDNNVQAEENQNSLMVQMLLKNLTFKQKKVLLATVLYGYTLTEYCQMENISYKVAYTHRQKALLRLKKALETA